MSIKTRKPPLKETVGAQYWCFNTMSEDGQWTENFEESVEKTEVVKNVKVTENTGTTDVYASGKIYDTDTRQSSTNIEVEVVAFPADTLAKARGDEVTKSGLICLVEKVYVRFLHMEKWSKTRTAQRDMTGIRNVSSQQTQMMRQQVRIHFPCRQIR